jgi:hypothetical protein
MACTPSFDRLLRLFFHKFNPDAKLAVQTRRFVACQEIHLYTVLPQIDALNRPAWTSQYPAKSMRNARVPTNKLS